jgi:hypothetical protein
LNSAIVNASRYAAESAVSISSSAANSNTTISPNPAILISPKSAAVSTKPAVYPTAISAASSASRRPI